MEATDTRSIASFDTKSQSSGNNGLQLLNSKDNVKVVIRVRPLNEREKNNGGSKKCVTVENDFTVNIECKPDSKTFNFDFVGDENIEQETMFNQIAKPIADGCLEGYNGTIFAYGQTGAGKTFTIQGPAIMINGEEAICGSDKKDCSEVEKRGILQRSFEYIFKCVEQERQAAESSNDGSHFEYLIRCSYLEIYNEQIMDLLEPTSVNLHIREDIKKGVYVEGLQEEVVQSANDMINLIQQGAKNRHVGSTSMNKESSRSHSVLTTIIETKSMKDGGVWNIKTSRFHIIDLAGSERSKYTNAVGERLKEAGMINKSLSALGNVINSLVDISEGKSRHVHYRDSKLTFLLRDSLGGNSKTVIIANISPSSICYGETLSTLKFAQRAKLIRNKAVINEDSSGTISLLKSEISRLKKELAENEKMYKQMGANPNGAQCSICKAMIGNDPGVDEEEDELLINNISVLEEMDTSALNATQTGPLNEVLKQKFKNQKEDIGKMKKRIVHLEGLLTANLDSLASQQKFYDNEIVKYQQQNKKLQQAVESYEKQCARDKMIIKFREDRISKLEANQPQTKDDQQKLMADLKKEVQMWKEVSDHNSQAAKLFAEKADLQNKLDQLKREFKSSPDSLSAQMRSLTELNESLNGYLRLYCEESKKEVENELSRVKLDYAEKIEQLNEQINELKIQDSEKQERHERQVQDLQEMINTYKCQVETLTLQYDTDKFELERINKEQIEQIKNEIEQICENKTEQEKEIQIFRVQMLEMEQLYEREKEKKADLEKQMQLKTQEFNMKLADLQRQLVDLESNNLKLTEKIRVNLEHYEQQIDTERKHAQHQLKEKEDQWDDELKELERKFMAESSEKQMLEDQCEQYKTKIQGLEDDNETLQQTLIYKDEQIEELKRLLTDKEKVIASLQSQIAELKQQSESVINEKSAKISQLEQQLSSEIAQKQELQTQIQQIQVEKDEVMQMLSDLQQEMKQLISDKEDLETQIKTYKVKIKSYQDQLNDLSQQLDLKGQEIQYLVTKVTQLEDEISQKNEQVVVQQQTITELQNQCQSLIKQQSEVIEHQVTELQHQLIEKDQIIKEKQVEFEQQVELVKEIQVKEIESLKQTYTEKIQQIESAKEQLQQEVQSLQVEKQTVLQQLQVLEQQLQEVETEHEKEIVQIKSEANMQVEEKERAVQIQLQKVVEEYSAQIEVLQVEKIQIEQQRMVEVEQLKQMESMNYEQRENELVQQIQEMQESHNVKLQDLQQTHQAEVASLKNNLEQALTYHSHEISQLNDTHQQQVKSFQQSISILEDTIKQVYQNYNEAIQTNKTLEHKNQELQSQLDQQSMSQSQISTMMTTQEKVLQAKNQELQSCHQRIESLTAQIQDLVSQKSNIQDLLSASQQECQTLANQLDQALAQNEALEQECSKIMNELSKQQAMCQDQQAQIQQFNNETTQVRSENDTLRAQVQTFKQQYIQLQNTYNDLQTQYGDLQQQKDTEISELQQEITDLQYSMQTTQREKGEASDVIKNLKDQVREAQSEIVEKDQTINSMTLEVNECKEKVIILQQDLKRQKLLLDDTITSLNQEHMNKYKELEQEYSTTLQSMKHETDTLKNYIQEQTHQISRLRQKNEEQNDLLKSSKDTMTKMVQKENELMKELQQNINEFNGKLEKSKVRVKEAKDERDQARKEWERARKEIENLKELIKLKDRQIEEQLDADERDKQAMDKIMKENKDLRNKITKREFEMKDLVHTLKFYSDEKMRLEKEVEKLNRENDELIGHKNPSQKIQHHVRIKEENNKLREENVKLQEELHKKIELLQKYMKGGAPSQQSIMETVNSQPDLLKEDLKKLKKENLTYQETINRLVDHILTQPSLVRAIGLNDEVNERLMQQNGPTKVKKAMEIISMLSQVVGQKEREVKDLEREIKKYEGRLDIVEKEKTLFKQQLEMVQTSSSMQHVSSYSNNTSGVYGKRSPINNKEYIMNSMAGGAQLDFSGKPSRLHVEGFGDDKSQHSHERVGISKQTLSPMDGLKQQREKENIQSSKNERFLQLLERDLFGQQQRSGSSAGRTPTYMSNSQLQNIPK